METKTCRLCEESKPLSEFYVDDGRPRSECKDCIRSRSAQWYRDNPERAAAARRSAHLLRVYGLTVEQFDGMVEAQGGRCAICSRAHPGGAGGWHVDHDHQTGEVRALLCASCNRKLGVVENREWMEKAMAYLESHGSLVAS